MGEVSLIKLHDKKYSPSYRAFPGYPSSYLEPLINIVGYNHFLAAVPTISDVITEDIYDRLLESVFYYTTYTQHCITITIWDTALPNPKVVSVKELIESGFTLEEMSRVATAGIVEFLRCP